MLAGDGIKIAAVALTEINLGLLAVNAITVLVTRHWKRRAKELFAQAEKMVSEAEETLVNAQSNEFKVCPTCGKIVQGICLKCTTGTVPCNVNED